MIRLSLATLLLFCCLTKPAFAAELILTAGQLAKCAIFENARIATDGLAIELETGELIEDDGPAAGFSYRPNEELLTSDVWIKKELHVENPRTSAALLLIGSQADLRARINGEVVSLPPGNKAGNYWRAYPIPTSLLRHGKNDIVLYSESKVAKIWIARDEDFATGSLERTRHPNRSAKSTDGGKTWDYDHLGPRGDIDGEYYVRLFLKRFHNAGTVTLPVLDVATFVGTSGQMPQLLPPLDTPVTSLTLPQVAVTADSPERVVVELRSGTTLNPDDKNWSSWKEEKSAERGKLTGRFFQARVRFTTSDPITSPRIQKVTLTSGKLPSSNNPWWKQVRVLETKNANIVRSPIAFQYERFDHPRLKQLRETYHLDKLIAGAKTEFEITCRLAKWSATQWKKGHLQECYPRWDALDILKPHADGTPMGGFCQQYNLVFLQACESLGIVGRAVSMGPGEFGDKIRGGHETAEIWSNDFGKWIYVDGNTGWYFMDEKSEVPLSLLELRDRQLAVFRGEATNTVRLVRLVETTYDWKGLHTWPAFVELRLIPRTNFLEQAAPLPLNQGMRGWFWTGHVAWTDDQSPAAPLYGNRVSDKRAWDWTLHQSRIQLEATSTPGKLLVNLDTVTPGFDTFFATIDEHPPQPISDRLTWTLHSGKNTLLVRSRNHAGREGALSKFVLELPDDR